MLTICYDWYRRHFQSNVRGVRCDQCAANTFGLSTGNPDGCTACFCFTRSGQCSQAEFTWVPVCIGLDWSGQWTDIPPRCHDAYMCIAQVHISPGASWTECFTKGYFLMPICYTFLCLWCLSDLWCCYCFIVAIFPVAMHIPNVFSVYSSISSHFLIWMLILIVFF